MKNLIYIVIFTFSIQMYAQEIVALESKVDYDAYQRSGKYFKDINGHLNKFLGTWKWQDSPTNPTKVLEITFYKIENEPSSNHFRDLLVSSFKYYENGVEIYNTNNNTSGTKYIFSGLFNFPNNLNKLRLYYSEPDPATNGFRYSFHIEYLPNTTSAGTPQLKWDVEIVAEVAENAELPKIPRHIILTKQ